MGRSVYQNHSGTQAEGASALHGAGDAVNQALGLKAAAQK